MMRLPKFLFALLTLVVLLAFAVPLPAAETKGTIKSVNPDKQEFVFADNNAKDWTIHLEKDAKVSLNGKEAKLSDLQQGDEATVIYEKKNDKLMATEVRCTRK